MKKRVLVFLMALVLCVCGMGECVPARAAVKIVYVVSNLLPVYQKPSTSSRHLGTMAYGEAMYCLAISGSWALVKNNSGAAGYCARGGLSTQNPNKLSSNVYINTANTSIYRYPSVYSKVLMKLGLNSCYKAVAVTKDGQWVRLQNGRHYGYVPLKFVSNRKTVAQSAPSMSRADRVAILAVSQKGKGYAYGAEGSAKFDCSGLTWYVYKYGAGVTLPRSSAQQAADTRFQKISNMSALKRGDLLCFSTSGGGIDHVGVYIGSGKFIHASQSKGQVVTSELDTDYYRGSFRWARRIV